MYNHFMAADALHFFFFLHCRATQLFIYLVCAYLCVCEAKARGLTTIPISKQVILQLEISPPRQSEQS